MLLSNLQELIVLDMSPDSQADGAFDTPQPERPSLKARLRRPLLIAAPVVLIVGGLIAYLSGGRYEETDNAYVQAGLVAITPNVSGHVIAVMVHENEVVKAGQVLFRIDPDHYQAALHAAHAQLADARSQVAARRADYASADAKIEAAQAQLDYATREAARQKDLLGQGISSQDQYEQAALAVKTARQAIAGARQDAAGIKAALSGQVDAPVTDQPSVRYAAANVNDAQLNLDYTTVKAPQDGIVTKVSQLQVGDYVAAGRPVFTLVGRHLWIEANFKESQLRYMRLGQGATVKLDAYPDYELKARISSFSPGTGNAFSLLPPENATGNWVKVVQRLPVELELANAPADLPLHAGLSALVTVDTGHRRHLFGSARATAAPSK